MKTVFHFNLYILVVSVLLSSCGESQEEKAAKLVKQVVTESAYFPKTYESVSLKIDSAFHTVYVDQAALEAAKKICDAEKDAREAEYDVDHSKSSIALWSGSYMNDYAKEERSQAQSKLEKAQKKLGKALSIIEKNKVIVVKRAQELANPEFAGWGLTHKYSLENANGLRIPGEIVVVADKEMKEVLFTIDARDDEYTKIFEKIREILEIED